MRSIKYFIQQSWLLVIASFFFGLLIAVTNAALQPRIVWNQNAKFSSLAKGLLPEADKFTPAKEEIEIKAIDGKQQKIVVYQATANGQTAGWVFDAKGSGFGGYIEMVVAVDAKFEKMAGFDVLSSAETPGIGDQVNTEGFRNQFKGAPATQLTLVSMGDRATIDSNIVAISGATISSTAVVTGINYYLSVVKAQMQAKGLISHDN